MSKNMKITLMAIIIVIFGNAIANYSYAQTHNIRIIHIKENLYIVYNYDLCYKHYVFGDNEDEVKTKYYNNKSIGYNTVECITGEEA